MNKTKKIYKKVNGINYYSNKLDVTGYYRLWQSNSHPNFKHWEAIKDKKK